jgi:hypothetical protein
MFVVHEDESSFPPLRMQGQYGENMEEGKVEELAV